MLEKLKILLSEYKDISEIEFTEETGLAGEIGLSSLEYFEIITTIEDEFGVSISDRELLEMRTVGDVIKCLKSKMK